MVSQRVCITNYIYIYIHDINMNQKGNGITEHIIIRDCIIWSEFKAK